MRSERPSVGRSTGHCTSYWSSSGDIALISKLVASRRSTRSSRGFMTTGSAAFTVITSSRVAAGSNDSITASSASRNTVPTIASGHWPTPVANPIASVDSITPASFGSFTLARYLHQPRGADDAEGACEAGADHQHHEHADDGQDDLRVNHREITWRSAAPPRPQRQDRREQGRQWQPPEGAQCLVPGGGGSRGHGSRTREHLGGDGHGHHAERQDHERQRHEPFSSAHRSALVTSQRRSAIAASF